MLTIGYRSADQCKMAIPNQPQKCQGLALHKMSCEEIQRQGVDCIGMTFTLTNFKIAPHPSNPRLLLDLLAVYEFTIQLLYTLFHVNLEKVTICTYIFSDTICIKTTLSRWSLK